MPFYKKDNTELLVSPTRVEGPGFSLDAETHTEQTYPVEGWYWFDSLEAAMAGMTGTPNNGVPQQVTMRQARLALLGAGLLDTVQAGVSAMPQTAQIEWEFAATVERTSPLVATLAAALGLDDVALDALFEAGVAL